MPLNQEFTVFVKWNWGYTLQQSQTKLKDNIVLTQVNTVQTSNACRNTKLSPEES